VSRIVVVSNRGPLSFRRDGDGGLLPVPAGGGLASSLHRLLEGTGTTWASVTMGSADREAVQRGLMTSEGLDLVPVVVDDDTYRQAYDVVANTTLWYCHHHLFDLPRRPRFDRFWRTAWDGYRTYNRAVANSVADRADEGATVLVQDYHFSLLGRMLAERRPDLRTVHFLHTPFADPNMLRVLPDDAEAELLDGMSGYDACGFHSHRWEAGFRACFADAGLTAPATFVAPLGIDAEALETEASSAGCAAAAEALRAAVGGRRTVVRVDRMEPSKNIVRGMLAFEELLLAHPEWHGKVVHLAMAYPSRQGLAEYLAYASEVEHTAERINRAFGVAPWGRPETAAASPSASPSGADGWTPIVLLLDDDRERSLAALATSDVLLVNPVRDGLNLVAKEGPLLNRNDGVLVLSREAGAWEELSLGGHGAVGVNPFDVTATAHALHHALSMPAAERAQRAAVLRATVIDRTSADWWADQLAAAGTTA
jgi:trehalose 6-phosphate synthase